MSTLCMCLWFCTLSKCKRCIAVEALLLCRLDKVNIIIIIDAVLHLGRMAPTRNAGSELQSSTVKM